MLLGTSLHQQTFVLWLLVPSGSVEPTLCHMPLCDRSLISLYINNKFHVEYSGSVESIFDQPPSDDPSLNFPFVIVVTK